MSEPTWVVRLSDAAQGDFTKILQHTVANFGTGQAEKYRDLMLEAIAALAEGPNIAGSQSRSEIRPGLRTLRVARRGRPARHVLLYRERTETIEILRIVHDAMDLRRLAPP